jgi:hypothetical protein
MKRLLDLVFGASKRADFRSNGGKSQSKIKRRQLKLESLENRRVFDVEFGSVIGIGNGESNSRAFDVAADSAGDRYVTGLFSGQVDFDESAVHAGDVDFLMSRGSTDAYLAKYAPDDSLLWVKRMGGDSIQDPNAPNYLTPDKGSKLEVDSAGNVYLVGTYAGSSDFGTTTLTSAGDFEVFVSKLNSSGSFLWTKRWGIAGDDSVKGVDVDSSGNVYVAAAPASRDVAIVKYSGTGALVWDKRIATASAGVSGITVDGSGNSYCTGMFANTVDFDPGNSQKLVTENATYGLSSFVLKLTTQGKFGWVSTFQGGARSTSGGIALDGSGNILAGGLYEGAVDFNPSSSVSTIGSEGAYIAKMSSGGALIWAKSINLTTNEPTDAASVDDIGVDSSGAIYVAGRYQGAIDLDPGAGTVPQTSSGKTDVFVAKLNSAGVYQWGESFGGAGDDFSAIALDGQGNIHLAGYFQYTVDFDAGAGDASLSTNGTSYKGFLKKLRQI